ncbi:MAG: CheR family methyltransferase [Blastocatellia bacterium]|nr:CheR family methyltransferase [Blastocatellia bacterium]
MGVCLLAASQCFGQGRRQIAWEDLPAALRGVFAREGFGARLEGIERATAERERQGEYDHLIFFMLQSERFTRQPRIEPAVSAYEFFEGLSEAERAGYLAAAGEGSDFRRYAGRVSAGVRARMRDLLRAIEGRTEDERLIYFRGFLRRRAGAASMENLSAEYARAMRFLYRKEFASRAIAPEQLAAYVSSLYRERGHSTDTQIEANFAVHEALASLKAQSPAMRIRRVLIIGPGMDFAPRTDLMDLFGPQSYQPLAVADSLLGLGLAKAGELRIHCVDINDRVVAHLGGLGARRGVTLSLLSGVGDRPDRPLTDDFKDYFRKLGRNIGTEAALAVPGRYETHLKKAVRIRPEIAEMISADRLNIITERYQAPTQYDLVVVTNVFPYFDAPELALALANIAAMLADGGHLIHNELQAVPSSVGAALGIPLRQARTVLIAANERLPLFDGIAIHRKE